MLNDKDIYKHWWLEPPGQLSSSGLADFLQNLHSGPEYQWISYSNRIDRDWEYHSPNYIMPMPNYVMPGIFKKQSTKSSREDEEKKINKFNSEGLENLL